MTKVIEDIAWIGSELYVGCVCEAVVHLGEIVVDLGSII